MAHRIDYHCDQCGKRIGNLYGPLFVTIHNETEPQVNRALELCSFNCLESYAKNYGKV
jgi:hypothetical protein